MRCASVRRPSGFTIYPGSEHAQKMYGQIRAIGEEAKRNGLAVVIWSYPRGACVEQGGRDGD